MRARKICRRNRPEAIARTRGLAAAAFTRAGFRDPTLILHWPEIVGPDVARLAQPLKLSEGASGGVLTLKAEPASAVFLQHQTRALCERINAYLGRTAIVRLRFVRAACPSRRQPPFRPSRPPAVPVGDPVNSFSGPGSA